jgi:hypothetical protein
MKVLRVLSWGLVLLLIGSAGTVWVVVTIAEGTVR